MPSPVPQCVHDLPENERQQVIDYVFMSSVKTAKAHWRRAVFEGRSTFGFAGYRWNTKFVQMLIEELEKPAEPKQEA